MAVRFVSPMNNTAEAGAIPMNTRAITDWGTHICAHSRTASIGNQLSARKCTYAIQSTLSSASGNHVTCNE